MKGRDASSLLHPASRTKRFAPFSFARNTGQKIHFISSFGRASALLTLIALVAVAFYAAPSSSSSKQHSRSNMPGTPSSVISHPTTVKTSVDNTAARALAAPAPLLPQIFGETIETFAADCTTPKTVFNVGETVCAVATNAPPPFFGFRQRRIQWVAPSGVVQQDNVATNPQSSSRTVSEVGTWLVRLVRNTGTVTATTQFVVRDPNDAKADLVVLKFSNQQSAAPGDNITFNVRVINNGPDQANSVVLADIVPDNTTFVSATQTSGPSFSCTNPSGAGGVSACTIATLQPGAEANFSFTYQVASGLEEGTVISNIATIAAANELNPSGNSAEAQVTVSTVGSPTCVVSTLPDITQPQATGQPGAVVTYNAPTGSNSTCGTITCAPASGSFFPVGSTAVVCSGEVGDSSSFIVTITDVEAPVIGNCPSNITVTADSSGSAVVSYTPPTATDNSGTDGVTVICDQPSGSSFPSAGSPHTVTCTATDLAGNTAQCAFQVTVNPFVTDCVLNEPADIEVNSPANECGATVTYPDITSTGSCGTITCDYPSGAFFPVGTTAVTCISSSGPSTTFNVRVRDVNFPVPDVATLPTLTGECSVTLETPTATDDCSGQISGETPDPRTYDSPGTYTVHWTYTDNDGNSTPQQQTVIVTDNTAPIPDAATLPDVTGECSATVPTVPTATDNCLGVINGTTSDPLTYTTEGTHTITWHFNDGNGNDTTQLQMVIVHDATDPEITAPPDVALQCASEVPAPGDTSGATASDNCGAPTVAVAQTDNGGAGSTSNPLIITLTFTATDAVGNTATDTQTITVIDNTIPTVTAPADAAYQCASDVPALDAGDATAADNCGAATITAANQTSNGGAGTPASPLVITRTFTATDAVGNTATATQTITVIDNTSPIITLNGASPVTVECHTSFTDPGATATDNCSTNVAVNSTGAVNVNVPGSYTITYTATDAAGNAATPVMRTVNVVDTTAPVINVNAQAITLWPPNHKYKTVTVANMVTSASDGCDGGVDINDVVISKVTSDEADNGNGDGDTSNDMVIASDCKSVQVRSERNGGGNGRVYTVTLRVRDAAGNTTTATKKVTVPKSQGNGGAAVEDAPVSTVESNCP